MSQLTTPRILTLGVLSSARGRRPGLVLAAGLVLATSLPLALAGCGGGGGAPEISSQTLSITSTTISEAPSGLDVNSFFEAADPVNWEIPLSGGCGGPYVVALLNGALPPGIEVVGGVEGATYLHHVRGSLLADGNYSFRIQVTDTACTPFAFAVADFTWTVMEGNVTIVGAAPALYPVGTYDTGNGIKNPLYPAIGDTLFGNFAVTQFLVAGGTPPYTLDIIDDPSTPDDDDGPPLGVSFPPDSATMVGAPQQIRDNAPFIFTVRATDALGAQSPSFTVQWEVTAPPIVFYDTVLPNAKCGVSYFKEITIIDGVPPFEFELVQTDVARTLGGEPIVTYQPPLAPIISPATATQRVTAAMYPATNALGPDYRPTRVPPEGIRLGDNGGSPIAANGALVGPPRRRGLFSFYVHVRSALVPNNTGQHNWRYFELNVAESEPPVLPTQPYGQDPSYTLNGVFNASQPYSTIADAEAGPAVYNPDSATHPPVGLQLKAKGGVRKDGYTDAPHASDVVDIDGLGAGQEDGTTLGGGYSWTVNPNPAGDGDPYTILPPGMALDGWTGVWRVATPAALVRQQAQALEFTVTDQQLPTQLTHTSIQRVNFAVGPDKIIITESTTSGTTTTAATWHDMNDGSQSVRVCMPYTGGGVVFRDVDATDLSATHTVPSTTGLTGTTALGTLLKNIDPMRACVTAAGWWNDVHNLHPWGARSGLHADRNGYDQSAWGENDLGTTSDYSRQPSITAVDIPPYRTGAFNAVSHSPATGVYTDGGKLYPFANGTYFGVFMVRSDATIYVPFAIKTSQAIGGLTFTGFGDGVMNAWAATGRSQLRIPHMAVSPDGRFAAMKIKTAETNYSENASTTKLVVFSLTGELAFGAGTQTWCIVDSGSNGLTTQGVYLYAPSLVMTNSHLYYLCGNLNGTLSVETASRQHFVYRFQFADPTTGAGVAGTTGVGTLCPKADALDTNWTNTSGAPLQTRFQLYSTPLVSGYTSASNMHYDGSNLLENSLAPTPFRVSADGRSIAILAMPDQTVAGVNSQAWHVWVDFQGAGVRRLSSAPRHITGGSARGYTLARGAISQTYENWHRYHGPTPHLEISDDGSKVAVVVNRFAGTPTYTSPTVSWPTAREDVIAYRTADNVNWTEIPVTGDGAGTDVFSAAGAARWRFGTLVFTKDNNGLVFWGGFSCYYAASSTSSYQMSNMLGGTLYGTDISSATAITGLTVTSLLAVTDGGASAGIAGYTTAAPYNPSLPTAAYSAVAGVIKPYGGFLSRNRQFLYMVNKGALVASSNDYPLVGVNINSTNTAASINGRTDFRGFSFASWPARRGFVSGTYNYYAYYGLAQTDYPAYRKHGCSLQVMPQATGWVLFSSQYQSSGPAVGTASTSYGGPLNSTYSYDYASYGGEVQAFNADVAGPIVRLSAFNADTSIRRMHFLEPSNGGGQVAFVYDTYSTANGSPSMEQLHYITGINFDATTGAQIGTPTRVAVEVGPTRISDAFAFGSATSRLYYAEGASNENAKALKEAVFTGGTVTKRTLSGTNKRFNVLHVAR